jgi:hypothetical protein
MKNDHFHGKSVLEHLKDARAKGAELSIQRHGMAMPEHHFAAVNAAKDTLILLLILCRVFANFNLNLALVIGCGWLVWKGGRGALLGWGRIERLHRIIEEERQEILYNREEETVELKALYAAKGLKGKLLEDVVSVFMADDTRALSIMLEEELGVPLESFEHPLKLSFYSMIGVIGALLSFAIGGWLEPTYGTYASTSLLYGFLTVLTAKAQKNQVLEALVWNTALLGFSLGVTYWMSRLII